MQAVTTSTAALSTAVPATAADDCASRIQDAAAGIPTDVQATSAFLIISTYAGSLIDSNGADGETIRRYLDGRVCVAKEMDENGSARMGAITLKDGSVYVGPIKEGESHGKGELTTQKYTYQGDFQSAYQHGDGHIQYTDGTTYVGQFRGGKFEGKGHIQYKDGTTFDGQFRAGQIYDCIAHIRHKDGTTYDGLYRCGQYDGTGCLKFPNGQCYSGEFRRGQREGMCKIEYEENSPSKIYTGQFLNGNKHGFGKLEYRNGDKYEGEFRENLKHGRGTYTFFANGNQYDGYFQNGQYHGKGTWKINGVYSDYIYDNGTCKEMKQRRPDVFDKLAMDPVSQGTGLPTVSQSHTLTGTIHGVGIATTSSNPKSIQIGGK